MQRLRIQHLTEYHFSAQVTFNQHRLLLRPREDHDVRIESSKLRISPDYAIKWQRDVFDNSLALVNFRARSDKLIIASEVVIQHYAPAPFDFLLESYAVNFPFNYPACEQIDLAAFQQLIFVEDQFVIRDWSQQQDLQGMETFTLLVKLNQLISRQFRYQIREEPGVQSRVPQLTIAEWDLLREGLTELAPEQLKEIAKRMAAQPLSRPVTCPLLDLTTGACPVYLHRPVACRTYGFYVQRDLGLYCHDIEANVTDGKLTDVVWGNHDAVDQRLTALGESRPLTDWFAEWMLENSQPKISCY